MGVLAGIPPRVQLDRPVSLGVIFFPLHTEGLPTKAVEFLPPELDFGVVSS